MPQREHTFEIDIDDPDEPGLHLLRIRFRTSGRDVVMFMVQYETYIEGAWRPVVRYDSAHGEAHRDRYDPEGNEVDKHWLGITPPFNSVLTAAKDDLHQNWRRYHTAFLAMRRGRR